MKQILEGLWDEYLSEKCSVMDAEERKEVGVIVALHEKARALLTKEQEESVEAYVDALCNLDALHAKKAFFKGCEFALSFLLAVGELEK